MHSEPSALIAKPQNITKRNKDMHDYTNSAYREYKPISKVT